MNIQHELQQLLADELRHYSEKELIQLLDTLDYAIVEVKRKLRNRQEQRP